MLTNNELMKICCDEYWRQLLLSTQHAFLPWSTKIIISTSFIATVAENMATLAFDYIARGDY